MKFSSNGNGCGGCGCIFFIPVAVVFAVVVSFILNPVAGATVNNLATFLNALP